MLNSIEHYRQIDIIRNIETEIEKDVGVKLFDISHWNSGNEYKKGLLAKIELVKLNDFFDYNYSYSFNSEVLHKLLNLHLNASECALSSSATSAIASICATISELGMSKICLLNPSYFSTIECLKLNSLSITTLCYEYDGLYHIPFDKIKKLHPDVVWITQPVFSTGTYIPTDELAMLAKMDYFLVCDASMCDIYNYPTINFDFDKSIIFFSPHKVVSINGIKFCYILCNKLFRSKIEDWGDIFSGSLPATSLLAINHYLSSNYKVCLDYHNAFIRKSKAKIKSTIDSNTIIEPCGNSKGSYETFTITKCLYSNSIDCNLLKDLFASTLVSFLPGCVNKFPVENGFCFRLNHTLDINRTSNAFMKIINYFGHH